MYEPFRLRNEEDELEWVPLHRLQSGSPNTERSATKTSAARQGAALSKNRVASKPNRGRTGQDDAYACDDVEKEGQGATGQNDREGGDEGSLEFTWGGVEELAGKHDLCATGPAFELALASARPGVGR